MTRIKAQRFGVMADGREVTAYTLSNDHGCEVVMLDWGATIQSVRVADRHGNSGEVTLGCDTLDDYLQQTAFFGASIGRVANRIAGGRFELDGQAYQLDCNQPPNHLHGGIDGFNRRLWQAEILEPEGRLRLTLHSADGDQGYPGNLEATLTVSLSMDGVLTLQYEATADRATPVNLTNHVYFNLDNSDSCLDHQLQLVAERYHPMDPAQIPLAEAVPVAGTPFDFRKPKALGQDLQVEHQQLERGNGYDHYFYLEPECDWPVRVCSASSGRCLEVSTSLPGVHLYSGNFLDHEPGRGQRRNGQYAGFCLETQYLANSPNRADGGACIVRPDQPFKAVTRFRFSVCSDNEIIE